VIEISIKIGDLRARTTDDGKKIAIERVDPQNKTITPTPCYVLGWLDKTTEGFDFRTVGKRPWDVNSDQVFHFVKVVMDLVEEFE
jgi:hypothetical protein